ncbi:MAG TPA: S8 family peptidase [Acidimicrobiales bacterium]|nr:S8 family peptidase [Acidimicrobiales bacterium]
MSSHVSRRASAAGILALALAAGLVGPAVAGGTPAPPAAGGPAQVSGTDRPGAIPGRYIVVFRKGTPAAAAAAARAEATGRGANVTAVYTHALDGFAAALSPAAVDALRRNPNVELVEADATVQAVDTQAGATWGLDRIDQRALPLDGSYTYDNTASPVTAYVIDTGILTTHTQFGGRASGGYTAIADGNGTTDCNGHGTHVAGTIGGSTYGVAKQVSLVAVRVLGCDGSGSNSGVIAGVDWVTGNHQAGQPAVANMSLGGGISSALDTAVANSIADGVTYAIAAGNSNANACNYSPARVAAAVTVGATTSSDARASYSNYGTCLDLFAPGSSITSAWYSSDTATNTISGTSMATPHVAGAAALYLQANPTATPSAVRDALVAVATPSVVTSAGTGSPNRLLYSRLNGTPPPPPPPPSGCSLPETWTGSLSGTNDTDIYPNGTYFSSTGGTFKGCLRGPSGTDFDLYLKKWNGSSWVTVAQSITTTSSEDITYTGTSGYYYFLVKSYSGSGTYTFAMQRP